MTVAVAGLAFLVLSNVLQDPCSKPVRGLPSRGRAQQIHRRSQGIHERVARAASSNVTSDPSLARLIDVAVNKVRRPLVYLEAVIIHSMALEHPNKAGNHLTLPAVLGTRIVPTATVLKPIQWVNVYLLLFDAPSVQLGAV